MLSYAKMGNAHSYEAITDSVAQHLTGLVRDSGYVSASSAYASYSPHWIRDSSWIAMSLLEYSKHAAGEKPLYSKNAYEAANRIISFNINLVKKRLPNIGKAILTKLEDPEFFSLSRHIPARVDENLELCRNDREQATVIKSWLMQHDSLPLVILSLRKKMELFGLGANEKTFLQENSCLFVKYLTKLFVTQCSSEWEQEGDLLHAYDVGVISEALEAMRLFAAEQVASINAAEITLEEHTIYKGGAIAFLVDQFVKDGVIYRSKIPLTDSPDLSRSVDAGAIFLFNEFGVQTNSKFDKSIERSTIKEIEERLFEKSPLPKRFIGDKYFKGGDWILLGAEFARYYAKNGRLDDAQRIVDYICGKYCDEKGCYLPEQEIGERAARNMDEEGYYGRNGNSPIQDLAWSYAALLRAIIAIKTAETSTGTSSIGMLREEPPATL